MRLLATYSASNYPDSSVFSRKYGLENGPCTPRSPYSRKLIALDSGMVNRTKREVMSALCHGVVIDSTFERSENVAITR